MRKLQIAIKTALSSLCKSYIQRRFKESLIARRVEEIKKGGVLVSASVTTTGQKKYGPIAVEAGLSVLVVQSTVTGLEHKSALGQPSLNLTKFTHKIGCPVIVGNCVTYQTCLELMETGLAAFL